MRSGHCPTTIKTTAGPVTVQRPKLSGASERFASQLFGTGVTKTNALEALVIAGFVRGLSTRDIEKCTSIVRDVAAHHDWATRVAHHRLADRAEK